jgi:protease I
MADQPLHGRTVALLATDGFEEVEYTEPRKALEAAGATCHLVAPKAGSLKAWARTDWGGTYDVDRTLDEADPADYDALVLPGGVMNPDKLRRNASAQAFVRHFFERGKPVAAICHGPWTLIDAGVVDGRRMTSYHTIQTDLKNAGADWVDEAVVQDGNLTTSRKPDDLPAFNAALVEAFATASTRA